MGRQAGWRTFFSRLVCSYIVFMICEFSVMKRLLAIALVFHLCAFAGCSVQNLHSMGRVEELPGGIETVKNELSQQMRVRIDGENLYIGARLDSSYDILYWFKKCMFNKLYTFYRVGIRPNTDFAPLSDPSVEPSQILNLAFSDNIGPFLVYGFGWCGGNHPYLDNQTPTAYNVSFRILLDGKEYTDDGSYWVNDVKVTSDNCILNPSDVEQVNGNNVLKSSLTIETVEYQIRGNCIQVKLIHKFQNEKPITIQTYYGMQSMFSDEVYTMTVGGAYPDWTLQNSVKNFEKVNYPNFCCFLEKNHVAHQASWLFYKGLGMHEAISDNDIIFIGNSDGKTYHKTVSNQTYKKGDALSWEGVYVWFRVPIVDNNQVLAYQGYVGGKKAIFINTKKAVNLSLPLSEWTGSRFLLFEVRGPISVEGNVIREGGLRVQSNQSAACILILQ